MSEYSKMFNMEPLGCLKCTLIDYADAFEKVIKIVHRDNLRMTHNIQFT